MVGNGAAEAAPAATSPDLARLLSQVRPGGPVTRLVWRAHLDQPPAVDPASAAATVLPYAWLLARVGVDGLRMTSAGHLPPSVVAETMAVLQDRVDWIGKANREEHTRPVLELRESARRLELVRRTAGSLVLTPAKRQLLGNPVQLWWHLASRLPDGRGDVEREAGTLLLLGP